MVLVCSRGGCVSEMPGKIVASKEWLVTDAQALNFSCMKLSKFDISSQNFACLIYL